ncbi:hypothetical protein QTG56_25080 (plasmid) [Rossellomorea sp. AcN35-11]|nr:hypothetical protein [Rossellomorea aquimaris]WJV31908.1 hypothetical protein QTG56_25080 [Rossellomorea sp. AcN35-11]
MNELQKRFRKAIEEAEQKISPNFLPVRYQTAMIMGKKGMLANVNGRLHIIYETTEGLPFTHHVYTGQENKITWDREKKEFLWHIKPFVYSIKPEGEYSEDSPKTYELSQFIAKSLMMMMNR